jgi:hypothetical protein
MHTIGNLLSELVTPRLWPAALMLIAAGCITPGEAHRPDPMPRYAELAQRYNRRLANFKRLRVASLSIVYTAVDEDGKKKTQSFNGALAIEPPFLLMLTAKHIGAGMSPFLWAGSNKEHYWLFDVSDKDNKKVYFGRHDRIDNARPLDLELPLHPRQIGALLGLVPLPAHGDDKAPRVQWRDGSLYVELPESSIAMWIDAESYLPVRVDLNDSKAGRIEGRLDQPGRVELEHSPDRPLTPARLVIRRQGRDEQFRLILDRDRLRDFPFQENWFNFEKLRDQYYKIPDDREHRIDLDRRHGETEVKDSDAASPTM